MKLAVVLIALAGTACVAEVDPEESDGDQADTGGENAEVAGSPLKLNIGFNGFADEFAYYPDWAAATVVQPGPRLCHTYVQWDLGNQAPNSGDATVQGSRAYVDAWLTAAQGHCDEALLSFKAMSPRAAPSELQFTQAFDKLVVTNWQTEAGFTGKVSYTPWNEPNNPAGAGNGLGVVIEANLAARYYLAMEQACRANGCKVAAGDFASNGNMWNAFEWNCANDNVAPNELCNGYSDKNPGHAAASYLDKYKNTIANDAASYGLGEGFRPEYFAFHGWHDINDFLNEGNACGDYGDCAIRRILTSLGGSWGSVALWDTESGIGQMAPLGDQEQACGAAELVRQSVISRRVERLYVTRLEGGDAGLDSGHVLRPAAEVLAKRQTTYPGCP